MCEPKDKYCYFKIENNKTSSIERDCSTKDKFGKLQKLFYNNTGYNPDIGCFVCRKSGGCNDKGNNLHEDMDENEFKCYCNTENCNERLDLQDFRLTIFRDGTDVEYSTLGPREEWETSGLRRETSESNMKTTTFAISTSSNGNTKNIFSLNRLLLMLLMVIFSFKMFSRI